MLPFTWTWGVGKTELRGSPVPILWPTGTLVTLENFIGNSYLRTIFLHKHCTHVCSLHLSDMFSESIAKCSYLVSITLNVRWTSRCFSGLLIYSYVIKNVFGDVKRESKNKCISLHQMVKGLLCLESFSIKERLNKPDLYIAELLQFMLN